MSGIVVLDTSCIKHLRDPAMRRRISGNLRAADLRLIPSVVNLFEIAKNPHVRARQGQLDVLTALAGSGPLLQWPLDLLRDVGAGVRRKERGRFLPYSGLEWALGPETITPDLEAKARSFMNGVEATFDRIHADGRRYVQAALRQRRLLDAWPDPRAFLEAQWRRPSDVGHLVSSLWRQLGLPGRAPVRFLLDHVESWRLAIDGFGFAVYERAVRVQQERRVGHADLLQLIHLGGFRRRLLVTADKGLLRAGSAILDGRYPGARTMSWEEFAAA